METIYLDLNVFNYMRTPRNDKNHDNDILFEALVSKLKKKYCFPYSQAHIFDLLRSTNEVYTNDDLNYINKISNKTIIGEHKENNELVLNEIDSHYVYDLSKKNSNGVIPPTYSIFNPNPSFKVDMDKLDNENVLYEYLRENNGMYSPITIANYLKSIYDETLEGKTIYNKVKKNIKNIINSVQESNLNSEQIQYYNLMKPILEFVLETNIEDMEKNFLEAVRSFFKATKKDFDSFPLNEKFLFCYCFLDLNPKLADQIKKNGKNVLVNIIRDGTHVFYASKSKYFVTEDRHSIQKIRFLYKVLNISTEVFTMQDFLMKFDFC